VRQKTKFLVKTRNQVFLKNLVSKRFSGKSFAERNFCLKIYSRAEYNLVLTHFSPRYQELNNGKISIKDIECEARNFYNGNLFLANDLDVFHLNQDGELAKRVF